MEIKHKKGRWIVRYDDDPNVLFAYLYGSEVRDWLKHNTTSRWAFVPDRGVMANTGGFSFGSKLDAMLFDKTFSGRFGRDEIADLANTRYNQGRKPEHYFVIMPKTDREK